MDTTKINSLENFVERHRADFDIHEPRPDQWAALEQQLGAATAPVVGATTPVMRLADAQAAYAAPVVSSSAPVDRPNWLRRYGAAAALVLLVSAAGASEAWKSSHNAPELTASARPASFGNAARVPDAALYQSSNPLALSAAEHSVGADSQLVRAVRGMETYYTSQLARRQSELRQLSGPGVAGMTADWQRELVSLDSSYRQLKQELPRHPQPDAVLTAMNRNLQIRLDILDQQLHLGIATEVDPNSGAYVLADSRHQVK